VNARSHLEKTVSQPALVPIRATAVCLVLAPALEVAEQLVSPLTGHGTAADLAAIDAHQAAFVTSVLLGVLATATFVPAFLGLATACLQHSARTARAGAALAVLSLMGFFAVRMVQGVQLQLVKEGVDRATAAKLVDHVASNPVGGVILAAFLGGSILGLALLAVAAWRTGLPKVAVVAFGVFPVLDLVLPSHLGTIASHLVLLGATATLAVGLVRSAAAAGDPVDLVTSQASA
jgi:hypothetical protein